MVKKVVLLCVAVCFPVVTDGQDSQLYRVQVNTSVVIDALSPSQLQTHSMTPGNVNFMDSDWYVGVNSPAGASVTFSAGPFINSTNAAYQRDSQLRLRRLRNLRGSTWAIDNQQDRTRIANGNDSATVSMSTTDNGSANVSIRVRFFTGANPAENLAAGNYITTVVGTIAPN